MSSLMRFLLPLPPQPLMRRRCKAMHHDRTFSRCSSARAVNGERYSCRRRIARAWRRCAELAALSDRIGSDSKIKGGACGRRVGGRERGFPRLRPVPPAKSRARHRLETGKIGRFFGTVAQTGRCRCAAHLISAAPKRHSSRGLGGRVRSGRPSRSSPMCSLRGSRLASARVQPGRGRRLGQRWDAAVSRLGGQAVVFSSSAIAGSS